MDYFTILNLHKEPFSNSPEPDLFYLSKQHQRCLQRMELAIRLCRGLNVVIGDIGTGKTTLCRELILRLSPPQNNDHPDSDKRIQTHLIMDPSFGSPGEFLLAVAKMFGLSDPEGKPSEWQLKEQIKTYLFLKGVDNNHIVTLIIDEGQKLPDFCVEILREFLNYETNEHKLLQIVIFAQEEFRQILKKHANFSDRINERYRLGPLRFKETREMIRFRLAKACREGTPPSLFTYSGLWAIHRATKGYPRKIITLCHQVILSLIIRNQTKVDWFVVMACVKRIDTDRNSSSRWRWMAGFAVVLSLVVAVVYPWSSYDPPKPSPSLPIAAERRAAPPPETYSVLVPPPDPVPFRLSVPTNVVPAKPEAPVSPGATEPPRILGSVTAQKGDTLLHIFYTVYGDLNYDQYLSIIKANPHISDPNQIKEKETISLPVLGLTSELPPSKRYWIRIAETNNLKEAYVFLKNHPRYYPPIRILPYWHVKKGLAFALVLYNGTENKASDRETAIAIALRLPQSLLSNARLITGEPGMIFLKKLIE